MTNNKSFVCVEYRSFRGPQENTVMCDFASEKQAVDYALSYMNKKGDDFDKDELLTAHTITTDQHVIKVIDGARIIHAASLDVVADDCSLWGKIALAAYLCTQDGYVYLRHGKYVDSETSKCQAIINEAAKKSVTEVQSGVWISTAATMIEEQNGFVDNFESENMDFNIAAFWITNSFGETPEPVNSANELKQYISKARRFKQH